MIQIKIEISETGIDITIDTPYGERMKFRSADEQEKIKKGSDKIPSAHITVAEAGQRVKKAMQALGKAGIHLQDPVHKRKSPKFKGKRICPYCENEFTPIGARQVFCTIEHKNAYNKRKNDLDQTIKKTEQLADYLEQENKESDQLIAESNQYIEKSHEGVGRLVEEIAKQNPHLTGKILCKECGGSFTPSSDEKYCPRCIVNHKT